MTDTDLWRARAFLVRWFTLTWNFCTDEFVSWYLRVDFGEIPYKSINFVYTYALSLYCGFMSCIKKLNLQWYFNKIVLKHEFWSVTVKFIDRFIYWQFFTSNFSFLNSTETKLVWLIIDSQTLLKSLVNKFFHICLPLFSVGVTMY